MQVHSRFTNAANCTSDDAASSECAVFRNSHVNIIQIQVTWNMCDSWTAFTSQEVLLDLCVCVFMWGWLITRLQDEASAHCG